MANVLTVYNDCVSDTRRFGKQEVRLIKVPANRLGHTRILPLKGEEPVERRIGSLARVIFDASMTTAVSARCPALTNGLANAPRTRDLWMSWWPVLWSMEMWPHAAESDGCWIPADALGLLVQ